jgi:hypothetical protein
MNAATQWAVQTAISAILANLDEDTIKRFIDAGLDAIEDIVASTDNQIDDQLVLPLCRRLRQAVDVPDND